MTNKKTNSNKKNIKWFNCNLCSFKTKRKDSLKNHKANKHDIDVTWHKCDICEYKSKNTSGLKRHKLNNHTEIKNDNLVNNKKVIVKKSKRKKIIPKPMREEVWRRDNGNNTNTKCPICLRNEISAFNYECGHILSEHNGGTTEISNLRAICGSCNKSMGTRHMDEFKNELWKNRDYTPKVLNNVGEIYYPKNIEVNKILIHDIESIIPRDNCIVIMLALLASFINIFLPSIGTCLCLFMTEDKLYTKSAIIALIQFISLIIGLLSSVVFAGLIIICAVWIWAVIYPIYLAIYFHNLSEL